MENVFKGEGLTRDQIDQRVGEAYNILMKEECIFDEHFFREDNYIPSTDIEILNEIFIDSLSHYIQTLKKLDVVNRRIRLLSSKQNNAERNSLLMKLNFIETTILNMHWDRIKKMKYNEVKYYFNPRITEEIFKRNMDIILDFIYKKHEYIIFE